MTDHEYEVILLLLNGIGRNLVILMGMQAALVVSIALIVLVR